MNHIKLTSSDKTHTIDFSIDPAELQSVAVIGEPVEATVSVTEGVNECQPFQRLYTVTNVPHDPEASAFWHLTATINEVPVFLYANI